MIRYLLDKGDTFLICDKDGAVRVARSINVKTGTARDITDEKLMDYIEKNGETIWSRDYSTNYTYYFSVKTRRPLSMSLN